MQAEAAPEATFSDVTVTRGLNPDGDERVRIVLASSTLAAREAITTIISLIDPGRYVADSVIQLEIALAEVMNNIVEHAYADEDGGEIDITIDVAHPGLHFTILDYGIPMPAGRMPAGQTANLESEAHEQAEGGYGFHLIRHISRKLRYTREGEANRLTFRIVLNEV